MHTSSQVTQIATGQKTDTASDSDSSWTSDEVTDQVKAVQDLKEGDIFANRYISERCLPDIMCAFLDSYCLEAEVIFGKPLVRIAKGLATKGDVILKFYDNHELYAKALSFFERLNKSDYICKFVHITPGSSGSFCG